MTPIGEVLRASRESRGVSLEEASASTKIRMTYLTALEEERFDVVGGSVYVKGFLRSYATYLGLDPEPLVAAYREREASVPPPLEPLSAARATRLGRRGPSWLGVGIVCAAVLLVFAVIGLMNRQPVSTATPPTSSHDAQSSTTTLPPATTAPAVRGVSIVLRYTAPSWTEVTADGRVIFEGTVYAGEERSFTGVSDIGLVLGYPPGVTLVVNGKDLGVAGSASQVYRESFRAAA